jgi:hypothetical protein
MIVPLLFLFCMSANAQFFGSNPYGQFSPNTFVNPNAPVAANFKATLTSFSEVPSIVSSAFGNFNMAATQNALSWYIDFQNTGNSWPRSTLLFT